MEDPGEGTSGDTRIIGDGDGLVNDDREYDNRERGIGFRVGRVQGEREGLESDYSDDVRENRRRGNDTMRSRDEEDDSSDEEQSNFPGNRVDHNHSSSSDSDDLPLARRIRNMQHVSDQEDGGGEEEENLDDQAEREFLEENNSFEARDDDYEDDYEEEEEDPERNIQRVLDSRLFLYPVIPVLKFCEGSSPET